MMQANQTSEYMLKCITLRDVSHMFIKKFQLSRDDYKFIKIIDANTQEPKVLTKADDIVFGTSDLNLKKGEPYRIIIQCGKQDLISNERLTNYVTEQKLKDQIE